MTKLLHALPFDPPVGNALRTEYQTMPCLRRWQALRKAALRELWLRVSGQRRLMRDVVAAGTRRVLIVYSWTTVGDAIMDLSARHLVPEGVRLDLCIAPHLAPIFAEDGAFHSVVTRLDDHAGTPDFVVLDCLSSAVLRDKARWFPDVPFASLRGHLIGERFDRIGFADRRMRQLFGLPPGAVAPPRLCIDAPAKNGAPCRWRVVVAIGARRDDRCYPHWAAVLASLVARWPEDRSPPEFWLLGSDNGVDQLSRFDAALLREHCVVKVGAGSLRDTARWLCGCDAFVGADGGLMHLAIALGRPVVALFTRDVQPAWRLPGDALGATLQSTTSCVGDIPPQRVAEAMLEMMDPARRSTAVAPGPEPGHTLPIRV